MKKILLGDVFEIETPQGYLYGQYVNDFPGIGELFSVIKNVYKESLQNIADALPNDSYVTFFPVSAAAQKKMIRKVGNFPVPEGRKKMPRMKIRAVFAGSSQETHTWDYWENGKRVGHVPSPISEEDTKLPEVATPSLPALIERVLSEIR